MRDLLLGRTTLDLDVVVVGDAPAIAAALHADLGGDAAGRLRVHEAFRTATLALPDGTALDLITARSERYPAPGALPIVAPGDLSDDLHRRDFTINAIALPLAPGAPGGPIDPLGGRGDLAAGVIRTLHDESFLDDPTRLLRAARYAGRLGFALAPDTAAHFEGAVAGGALGTVTIDRLSHEFVRLLAEPQAAAGLDLLAASGALAAFAPALRWEAGQRAAFARLDVAWDAAPAATGATHPRWMARLALLVAHHAPDEARAAAASLHLPGAAIALAGEVAALRALLERGPLPGTASALGRLLDPFSVAAILAGIALAGDEQARDALRRYLDTIRPRAPTLRGDALRALGLPPGPLYRDALAALRDFVRDTPAATADEERAFLGRWLAARGLAERPPADGR